MLLHIQAKRLIEGTIPPEEAVEAVDHKASTAEARERERVENINKKLSYEAHKLGYARKSPVAFKVRKAVSRPPITEQDLKLPFASFLYVVLQFQLRTHEKYLEGFKIAFRHFDENADGVLSASEFQSCFLGLRGASPSLSDPSVIVWTEEEEIMFTAILDEIDPNKTDRITYSTAASCLNRIGRRVASATQRSEIRASSSPSTPLGTGGPKGAKYTR